MNRIRTLASLTKGSHTVCDIGCDHAYVIIEALENYGVTYGIASDIATGPLERAKENILNHHLENRITCVCSNGFEKIDLDRVDTILISGLGGLLMIDILSPYVAQLRDKKLILSPNSDVNLVRQFLYQNGFYINFEQALLDKEKYYELLVARYGTAFYDEYDLTYGPILRKKQSKEFQMHYQKRISLFDEILTNIKEKKEAIQMEKRQMEEILAFPMVEKKYILNTKNYYRTYFLDDELRPLIIVSPGGGYRYTSPRESEPVVKEFQKLGYHVAVINYRETLEAYPKPGMYLATAINEIVEDKRVKEVFGLGFSAGGHCILEVLLHADDYHLKTSFKGLMLGYPVITSKEEYAHKGSFENLLMDQIGNEQLKKKVSLETQVTHENAPDLFLWGTVTDESVSVLNSLLLIEAYHRAKANIEYHMFPFGGHAMSVANSYSAEGNSLKISPYIARWVEMANEWLQSKLK